MVVQSYNRKASTDYARRWVFARNPNYYDFSKIGGDCTNFVSQCLFAGSNTMNYSPNTGWFYNSVSDRAPAWTGVNEFKNFILNNIGVGPFGTTVNMNSLDVGDIILLGRAENDYYHNTVVVGFEGNVPLIACHTFDQFNKPITSYIAKSFLCIHVVGVRR